MLEVPDDTMNRQVVVLVEQFSRRRSHDALADVEWNVGLDLPDGMALYGSYAPRPGGGQKNTNKAYGGDSGKVAGFGWDVVLTHSGLVDGLNIFAGLSEINQGGAGDREPRPADF